MKPMQSITSNKYIIDVLNDNLITPVSELDESLLREAATVLSGQRNFSAFTTHKGRMDMLAKNSSPVKTLKISFGSFEPFLWKYSKLHVYDDTDIKFIAIKFTAESFLLRMVRGLTSALIAVSTKQIPLSSLRDAFKFPHAFYFDRKLFHQGFIDPQGLYLNSVSYPA
ncbi:hypothetical protein GJ496_009149 [Pomphorhynchus laevis]|nr:hypothetical protein GJ496_009149 [Pomphorhynchus laevis]